MNTYIGDYAASSGGLITIQGIIPKKEVEFYAYITSFSDNMTSTWNEEQVYGRQDPIGTFQNTLRKISLSFDVPAGDLIDAKINLEYINRVKQFMYPAYSSTGENNASANALSLSKSPLVRIKFANFIQDQSNNGLLGWIGSFNAAPVIEMGMFSESKEGVPMLYPKVYTVSIDFTPQHEFDLGYKKDGEPIDSKFTSFPYDGGFKS
jgi:hypothetical protein